MGFFSQQEYDRNWSLEDAFSPRQRLVCRLEDLTGRLAELEEDLPQNRLDPMYDKLFYSAQPAGSVDRLCADNLYTVQDVLTAIDRTRERLRLMEPAEEARAAEPDMAAGQTVLAGFAAVREAA